VIELSATIKSPRDVIIAPASSSWLQTTPATCRRCRRGPEDDSDHRRRRPNAPSPTSGAGSLVGLRRRSHSRQSGLRDLPAGKGVAVYEQLRRQRSERIVAQRHGSAAEKRRVFGSIVRDAVLPFVFKFMVTDKSLG